MNDNQIAYLRMEYDQGIQLIKHWIDARYKMLQFVGTYNGAVVGVLTAIMTLFRDGNSPISPNGNLYAIAVISLLSIFIALMGLATEFSTASYLVQYFEVLREIEEKLNRVDETVAASSQTDGNAQKSRQTLKLIGIASNGKQLEERIIYFDQYFHKRLPVHRAHKFFYYFLIWIWLLFLPGKLWGLW